MKDSSEEEIKEAEYRMIELCKWLQKTQVSESDELDS